MALVEFRIPKLSLTAILQKSMIQISEIIWKFSADYYYWIDQQIDNSMKNELVIQIW